MTVGEDRSACESVDLLRPAFRRDSLKERREGGREEEREGREREGGEEREERRKKGMGGKRNE